MRLTRNVGRTKLVAKRPMYMSHMERWILRLSEVTKKIYQQRLPNLLAKMLRQSKVPLPVAADLLSFPESLGCIYVTSSRGYRTCKIHFDTPVPCMIPIWNRYKIYSAIEISGAGHRHYSVIFDNTVTVPGYSGLASRGLREDKTRILVTALTEYVVMESDVSCQCHGRSPLQ